MSAHDSLGLFDPPGPVGKRRMRIASIASLVTIASLLALALYVFARGGGLEVEKWSIFLEPNVAQMFGVAALQTLRAFFVAGVLSLAVAVILAVARYTRIRILTIPAAIIVETTRSVPTLLLLYATILLLPSLGLSLPVYWQLVVALTLSNIGMLSEIIRANMMAVPGGQYEAGLSLGLSMPRAIVLVILPQGFSASMPALVAQMIFLLKTTTLGYVISYTELLFAARVVGEFSSNLLQSILVISALFFVVNYSISAGSVRLERRLNKRQSHEQVRTTKKSIELARV